MKWPSLDARILIPFEAISMLATAAVTPWWGTVVVAALLRLLFFTSTRRLAVLAFLSWVSVCVYRDLENLHGPSRVFAKLLSLSQIGFALDSQVSRAIVFAVIGFVGFALALFSAGTVRALQALLSRRPVIDVEKQIRTI